MRSVLLLSAASFVAALVFTAIVRSLSLRFGFVDAPDSHRKLHACPVPRTGGVAIVAAFVAAFAVLLASPSVAGQLVYSGLPLVTRLLPAASLVFFVGLIDDIRGLRPWHKLLVELLAAGLAISQGLHIMSFAGHPLPPWLGAVLTAAWLIGCTNAFNLIDGMDGLATGLGLLATATILMMAVFQGRIALAFATAPLVGALLAFLLYNFNPASIFLGDSGSLLIGFLLGSYSIHWSQKSTTFIGMAVPLMALAIPLADTALSIARRFLRGQPIFSADRGHVHYRLLARGLSTRQVVCILYAAAGTFAMLAVLLSFADQQHAIMVVAMACVWAWIAVERLNFIEFSAVRRMFTRGRFRRHLNAYMDLESFDAALQNTRSFSELWETLRDGCRKLGFTEVCLEMNGSIWSDGVAGDPHTTWRIMMPLGSSGSITLARPFNADATAAGPGCSDGIRASLVRKLQQIHSDQLVTSTAQLEQLLRIHDTPQTIAVAQRW